MALVQGKTIFVFAGLGIAAVVGVGAWRIGGFGGGSSATSGTPAVTLSDDAAGAGDASGSKSKSLDFSQNLAQAETTLGASVTSQESKPLSAENLTLWVRALESLQPGYSQAVESERGRALAFTAKLLDRAAINGLDPTWAALLKPTQTMLIAGLRDESSAVRSVALGHAGKIWEWNPGRVLMPVEEKLVEDWKGAIYHDTVVNLNHNLPTVRASAVACLAVLPIPPLAAPAATKLNDPSDLVRAQTILGFARRPDLLPTETLLPRLYDESPQVVKLAERVLKQRGLSQEHIGMGKLIFHPEAEMRLSAMELLARQTDLDEEVWLLHLSRDHNPGIRIRALAELAKRQSAGALERIEEMAAIDPSAQIRAEAKKLIPAGTAKAAGDTTAALPPLPGAKGLTPTAN